MYNAYVHVDVHVGASLSLSLPLPPLTYQDSQWGTWRAALC